MKAVEQTSQDTDEYNHEYLYFAGVEMNGKQLEMIIETGYARTLVPKQWFTENINCPIKQSTATFTAFGVGELKSLGTFNEMQKPRDS